jgi:diaminopimelate epimerase
MHEVMSMSSEAFLKMHGLGNDFVVFDRRKDGTPLSAAQAKKVADRKLGIGADQVITLLPDTDGADVFMQINNADGSEVAACGNATRCVAGLLINEGVADVKLRTNADLLLARHGASGIAVDMGEPGLDWDRIPVAREVDTLALPLKSDLDDRLVDPVGVNMGNPHAVFFVADADDVDMELIGPPLEHDSLFPERANIEVATVRSRDHIRMRVWERGVGVTLACGTGACATLVAAVRRGLTERRAVVELDGGELIIEWRDDNHVIMEGPASLSFTGTWEWEQ